MLRISPRFLWLLVTVLLLFWMPVPSRAETLGVPRRAASPYDLIEAVNALRSSYGQPPYVISSILMSTAQNQPDYMAATGVVSHTGAGGLSVTDRLLAAGYPLAGDLSLGGFRSENITAGGEDAAAQAVIKQWMGDSVHLTTMISADLTEIGAGVSVNGGKAYFVIDCARPADSGQRLATSLGTGSTVPAADGIIIPVTVSTPNADGDLIHEVKAGQTLWQIAISYNTKIDEIKRLNNLPGNDIYPGTRLLIRKNAVVTPQSAAETATLDLTSSAPATSTAFLITPTGDAIRPGRTYSETPIGRTMGSVMGIIAIAFITGAVFVWLGNPKRER